MNFERLLRDFQRTDTGAKVTFFGVTLALAFVFFPWFQIDQIRMEDLRVLRIPEISSGFGAFPVFGLLVLAFTSSSLLVFVQHFFGAEKIFNYSHGKAWMMLGGQALFTLLIAFSIFFTEMRNDSTAQMRFGIFASVFAQMLVVFGGYLLTKAEADKEAKEVFSAPFSQELNHLNIRPEQPSVDSDQLSLSDANERRQSVLR